MTGHLVALIDLKGLIECFGCLDFQTQVLLRHFTRVRQNLHGIPESNIAARFLSQCKLCLCGNRTLDSNYEQQKNVQHEVQQHTSA